MRTFRPCRSTLPRYVNTAALRPLSSTRCSTCQVIARAHSDRDGAPHVDFLLRAKRDHAAARAFFERVIDLHGVPEKITIDKSGANTAAIASIRADSGLPIELRQSKYLNNLVEQDHRMVKRITRPMLGFKTFSWARILLAGIKVMRIIRKHQLGGIKDRASYAANQFYSLVF